MTLTKAIEGAREALTNLKKYQKPMNKVGREFFKGLAHQNDLLDNALAALPDKPMTESELVNILKLEFINKTPSPLNIIRALKDANVLYVKEK